MSRKNNALPEEQQTKLIELLNRRLADAIDLQLQSRQASWNVKGPHFMALRELFGKVAQGVEEDANLIAVRIVQLGGMAEGTAHAVAGRSSLDGKAIGLHPVVSLAALIAGAELFGITGALLASPVAGVLQALLVAIWTEWRVTHPKTFQRAKDDLAEKVEEVVAETPGDPEPPPKVLS